MHARKRAKMPREVVGCHLCFRPLFGQVTTRQNSPLLPCCHQRRVASSCFARPRRCVCAEHTPSEPWSTSTALNTPATFSASTLTRLPRTAAKLGYYRSRTCCGRMHVTARRLSARAGLQTLEHGVRPARAGFETSAPTTITTTERWSEKRGDLRQSKRAPKFQRSASRQNK